MLLNVFEQTNFFIIWTTELSSKSNKLYKQVWIQALSWTTLVSQFIIMFINSKPKGLCNYGEGDAYRATRKSTLLSYFAKKKEKEAILVQTLGVVSIYIVIVQLAFAGAMPLPQFSATSTAVVAGLVLNLTNYHGWVTQRVWQIWENFITIVGISVLPQVNLWD